MIGFETCQNIITIVVILMMYIAFVAHVFLWFKHNLESSHEKQNMINQSRQQSQEKQDHNKENHSGLSLFDFLNTPIISLLQQQSTRKKEKKDSKLRVLLTSCLLTVITCLLLLSFCLDDQLLSAIIKPLKLQTTINQGAQINNLSHRVLYHNEQQQDIYKLHLISIFAFMAVFLRTVSKIDKKNEKEQSLGIDFMLRLIMILADPWFISIIILEMMAKFFFYNNNKRQKTNMKPLQLIKYLILLLLPITQLCYSINYQQQPLSQAYTNTIFPKQFTPQSNLMWILYAHMFTRYLHMYQLVMLILPLSFAIPLSLLKINYQTKIICQYFVIIFSTYHCTDLHVYFFWVLVFFNINNSLSYRDPFMKTINKILGLLAFLGSTLFLLLYKRMVSLFLTTWMVNIGYPFLFGCITWALIVVWLTELIRIQLQQIGDIPYDPKQPGKAMQIIHQSKQWIKINYGQNIIETQIQSL